jgi:glycosyltransferase involved in cell wall biosynthesis
VSVCVVTYNHTNFIRECLQSIVDQKTDFEFEVIVGDDCSTDGTREIVQEFAERYPDIVRPLLHPQNLGPTENYLAVHGQARGEYVAHIDGDDYALPGKLQAQADFLDRHHEYVIVWHRMKVLDANSGRMVDDLIDIAKLPEQGFTQDKLLSLGSVGSHSSKMYRARYRFVETSQPLFLDFFIDAHQLAHGKGGFVDGMLGVYRANIGVSRNGYKTRFVLLDNLRALARQFPQRRRAIAAHLFRLMLGDIVHRRPTLGSSFAGTLEVFHPLSLLDMLRSRRLLKMFRLPSW